MTRTNEKGSGEATTEARKGVVSRAQPGGVVQDLTSRPFTRLGRLLVDALSQFERPASDAACYVSSLRHVLARGNQACIAVLLAGEVLLGPRVVSND